MPFRVALETELAAEWQRAMRIIATGNRYVVQNAVTEGEREAKRVRTFQDRSGKLFGSIRGYVDGWNAFEATGILEARIKYASFVDGGTRPHEIIARNARALRWESADGVHFARRVQHPGTRPYPFMGPACLKMERVIERDMELVVQQAAKVFER